MNIGIHKPVKKMISTPGGPDGLTIQWTGVEAMVYGDFAIHCPIGPPYADEKWTLTHVKSGRRVPHNLLHKYQLEGLIVVLADLDWDFKTHDDLPPRTKQWAKVRIRAFEKLNKEEHRRWSYKIPTRKPRPTTTKRMGGDD